MRRILRAGVVLGAGLLLAAPHAGIGQTSEQPSGQPSEQPSGQTSGQPSGQAPAARTPVATTPHFAFYDDFETNLNDALIAAGVARKFSKPELFRAGDEVACFGKLPPSVRSAWQQAVDYYAEIISPVGFGDRQQYLLRADLAGFEEEPMDAGARQFVALARSFRAAAAPAYTACRWPAQDEKNRRFIADLEKRLATAEAKVASRLQELYRQRWGKLPILVDVVETVDWSGANSILLDPLWGHLLLGSSNPSENALEIVFHEASHLLMGRNAPVRQALGQAASAASWTLPGDLWHVVLFYTTGETVRRILEADGQPGYTPTLYEIFERGTWGEYRQALESAWRPYVDGKRALPAAAADLVAALKAAAPPPAGDGPPKDPAGKP